MLYLKCNKLKKTIVKNSNYIKKIFNKNIDELIITDIEEYFSSEQEETSVIEFKSGNVEIIDLYKEITAFLNTEGGLLIIGSPREKKKKIGKNEKVICQGELTYSKFKNKDWLYQKIASNITPPPINLQIVEFITENGAIYLIDVPQSLNPPHQSSADGRYYIRLEREAKPAPHGIVQALFDKRRSPKLLTDITIKKINDFQDNITISIKNKSVYPAEKVSFIVDIHNVENVESKLKFNLIEESIGSKYSMSNQYNQILVQIISIPINLKVTHFGKEYIVLVGYWCKDLDFNFYFETYDPKIKRVVTTGTLYKAETPFTKELERIRKNAIEVTTMGKQD